MLVVGGGLGGVAAALAAAEAGAEVVLTEEGPWLGGQLTSQAVPLDEHPWAERFGVTARYRRLRDGIRAYYRDHYPLTAAARARRRLNPGASFVSALSHEPRVALAVLDAMLAPHRSAGRVRVRHAHVAEAALCDGDRVRAVRLRDTATGTERVRCGLSAPSAIIHFALGSMPVSSSRVESITPLHSEQKERPWIACTFSCSGSFENSGAELPPHSTKPMRDTIG